MIARLGLGTKLISGFLLVACIAAAIGVVGFVGLRGMGVQINQIGGVNLPSIDSLLRITKDLEAVRVAQRTLLDPRLNETDRTRQFSNIDAAIEDYGKQRETYEALPKSEQESLLWKDFLSAFGQWQTENTRLVEVARGIETLGIMNPDVLAAQLQGFRGDHYKALGNVKTLLLEGTAFEGGEDAAACAFGKWHANFATNNKALDQALKDIDVHHKAFHDSVKQIKALVAEGKVDEAKSLLSAQMAPAADAVLGDKGFGLMHQEAQKAVDLYAELNTQAMGPCVEKQRIALDQLGKVVKMNTDNATNARTSAEAAATRAETIMLVTSIIGVLAALGLGMYLARSITKPINRVIAVLQDGSTQVNSAAGQVAQSSQSMAGGASEQASSLEEISASMEQMSSMTRQTADGAKQADNLMKDVGQIVVNGGECMNQTSKAIGEIRSSSEQTAKIIKTIDEIAFQTNLLALNAAVEAARAGDAGKGFAVVAEEVRNLAQRSAEAAKNTAQLLEQAKSQAEGGVHVVAQAAETFEEIRKSVERVTVLVREISTATLEQSQGIDQVNQALSQLDQVTQSNAASAEESASAAEELSAQANELGAAVGELSTVVGGKKTADGSHVAKTASVPAKKHAISRPAPVQQLAAKKSTEKAGLPVAAGHRKVVSPEEVIPLSDDDMAEF